MFALAAIAGEAQSLTTKGGEGGREIVVTSLEDAGPGTLRNAVSEEGPRIITFAVAGEIWLRDALVIMNPNVTIAGETAPTPGITLMGDKIRIRSHDVLLRHVRIRVGELEGGSDPENRDGISVDGPPDSPSYNIHIDHCSVAWALDEGVQLWTSNGRNIAVTNSIIAEGLRNSVHPKGPHSMGLIVGPGLSDVLVQGNLFAHNAARNPVIAGGSSAVIVNNLIYNPDFAAIHLYARPGEPPTLVTAAGNLVIAGRNTNRVLPSFNKGVNEGSRIFYDDNQSIGVSAFLPSERLSGNISTTSPLTSKPPVWRAGLRLVSVLHLEETILSNVGARPWDRDELDRRVINQTRGRQGRIVDTPSDKRLARGAPAAFRAQPKHDPEDPGEP